MAIAKAVEVQVEELKDRQQEVSQIKEELVLQRTDFEQNLKNIKIEGMGCL